MIEIKECKNCAYFRQHYAKDTNGQWCEVSNGDCTNPKIKILPFRRCFNSREACQYWQPITTTEPKEDINDIIKQAAANIELLVKLFDIK